MTRGSNPRKVDEWTERLLRFRNSDATAVQFCRDEGVSQPAFYQWKRKLRKRLPTTGAAKTLAASARNRTSNRPPFQTVQVTSPSEKDASQPLPAVIIRMTGGIQVHVADNRRS